jgi:glycosyltransferase involved in cell wall biosynthesis
MTRSPKVSVIIPNYNHADHLKQRIDSVLNQTFQDFEVILLDDQSTDGSKDIILMYQGHPKIKIIELSEKNSGNPFKQWQKGLNHTSGEWVWFAESDDYAASLFLEKMIIAIDGKTNIGLAYCDSVIVQGEMSAGSFAAIKNSNFATDRWSVNYINNGKREIFDYLLLGGTINNSSAVLFNREIITRLNPFDLNFRYIGDKYAFVKTLSQSDVVYVSEPLNYFRDPFNTKHADRFIQYFYEQFLVFDWVYKNLIITDESKFLHAFYANTSNSLFRDWSKPKFLMYQALLKRNRYLMLRSVSHNFWKGISSLFKKN